MRGSLLRNFSLCARNLHLLRNLKSSPAVSNGDTRYLRGGYITENASLLSRLSSGMRFFSSENGSSDPGANPDSEAGVALTKEKKEATLDVEDVGNKELKLQIEDYFNTGNEEVLPTILESVLKRRLVKKHEETDDELMDELEMKPLENVKDEDFESDFEELHSTDEEIDNLYNARDYVMKDLTDDPYFHMDDKKWDDMIKEAVEDGDLDDTKECEAILEDMLSWDKLLPDEIKKKVEKKFNEIGDRVEKGEIEVEEGYELFKEFEDQMVLECAKLMEAEEPPKFGKDIAPDNKALDDDPPGEGPILRWQTRVVFCPGGDAWHPKNRKVKLAVTVKELGLSKHQFVRLRELAGKRYNPGKDELTITSERFEHREENRKDCLRTLFALIEEAGKARKLVEHARISDVKERLKANPKFMQRLQSKKLDKGSKPASAC
ncbi:Ribosomal protein S24/S35- mitochondrial [Striga hermonthica]|uniref:Ribosomal protein S24/S35- mitochondrial n=1 Tax=Striga hermonthica TaxID=68872 RepID=A0A9N7RP11_STRHE|nr:Ribosomal protein S24/S35- mitochondrial [Striga hermonthica]